MENFAKFDIGEDENVDLVPSKYAVVASKDNITHIIKTGTETELKPIYNMLKSSESSHNIKVYMLNISQIDINKYRNDSIGLSEALNNIIHDD